jgi:hypothetical protein
LFRRQEATYRASNIQRTKPILPLPPTSIRYRFCSVITQHNRRREIFPPISVTNPNEKFAAVPAYDFLFCYIVEDSPGGSPRFPRPS